MSFASSLKQKAQLLEQLSCNFSRSLAQDTGFFKVASVTLAGLLMVTSRSVIAANSAKQSEERGDSEEKVEFARNEAMKTIVREVGAVVLSYGVMSGFNVAMDKPAQLAFGVKVKPQGVTGPVTFVSHALQILLGLKKEVPKAPAALGDRLNITPAAQPNAVQRWLRQHVLLPLVREPQRVLAKAGNPTEAVLKEKALLAQGMRNFRQLAVPLVGAGIAMYLSGWVLERKTLLQFDEIVGDAKQLLEASHPNKHKHALNVVAAADPLPLTPLTPHPSLPAAEQATPLAMPRHGSAAPPHHPLWGS